MVSCNMESEAIMNFLYFVTLKSIGLFDTLNIFSRNVSTHHTFFFWEIVVY